MKEIIFSLSLLLVTVLYSCSEEKVEERLTDVLVVSNQTLSDGNHHTGGTKVTLYIPTQAKNIGVSGSPDCLKTHEVKVGETYKIMLKYNQSGTVAVTPSLCTLTALIKKQNGRLNNETN